MSSQLLEEASKVIPNTALLVNLVSKRVRQLTMGADHPATLQSRNNLAESYRDIGRTALAIAMHETTVEMYASTMGIDHPATLASRNNLAGRNDLWIPSSALTD